MIPQDHEERRLLIAEYVLGLHRGERAAEIKRWLAEDDEAGRLARRWREHWVGAVDLLPPARPPARLWRRVARETGLARPWWSSGWASVAVWRTVSAALLVAVVLLVGPLRQPAPVYTVVLQAPGESARPGWRITVSDAGGRAVRGGPQRAVLDPGGSGQGAALTGPGGAGQESGDSGQPGGRCGKWPAVRADPGTRGRIARGPAHRAGAVYWPCGGVVGWNISRPANGEPDGIGSIGYRTAAPGRRSG